MMRTLTSMHGPRSRRVVAACAFGALVTACHSLASAPLENAAWRLAADAPLPVYEAQGAVVDARLYIFGGFYDAKTRATTRVQRYDLATDHWDTLAPLPEKITHAGHTTDGRHVFLVGGFVGDHPGNSTAHAWSYDVAANRWSPLPDLPAPRGGGGAAVIGRTLHFVGGTIRNGDDYAGDFGDHWTLDLDDDHEWRRAAPLPNPRNHLGAIAMDGRIYVIGGQHLGDEIAGNQSTVQRYDPATDAWTALAPLPAPRGHISSSLVVREGKILLIGGLGNGSHPLTDVLEYDPATNAWRTLAPLPAPRQSPVAKLLGSTLVTATGGYNGPHATTWISRE